jgi:hypothetical protein
MVVVKPKIDEMDPELRSWRGRIGAHGKWKRKSLEERRAEMEKVRAGKVRKRIEQADPEGQLTTPEQLQSALAEEDARDAYQRAKKRKAADPSVAAGESASGDPRAHQTEGESE